MPTISDVYQNTVRYNKEFVIACSSEKKQVWKIEGEDPNCDFGGSHHSPCLGYFKGTFIQVAEYALTLPNFVTWGGGGRLVPINVVNL